MCNGVLESELCGGKDGLDASYCNLEMLQKLCPVMCSLCTNTSTSTATMTTVTTATTITSQSVVQTVPVDFLPLVLPSSSKTPQPSKVVNASAALTQYGVAFVSDWKHATKNSIDAIINYRQKFDFHAERNPDVMTLGTFKTQIRYNFNPENERHSRLARQSSATGDGARLPCRLVEERGPGIVQAAARFVANVLKTGVAKPADLVGVFGGCTEDPNDEFVALVHLNIYLLRPDHIDTEALLWQTSTSDAIAMHKLADNVKNMLDTKVLVKLFQVDDGAATVPTTCTRGE